MFVQLGPVHEINLRGATYELVPEKVAGTYDKAQESMWVCTISSGSRLESLLTYIKLEVDEDSDQIKF